MLFTSWVFAIFLPVVLVGYFLLARRSRQNHWLLLASCVFYGWWDFRFLGLIAITTGIDFAAALALDGGKLSPRGRKWVLAASMASNLGMLGFFKYFHFFEENLVALLSTIAGRPVHPSGLDVILPIGISFFTFQSMSYTIDVYRGELKATRNFLEFATAVLFFPHLVAGPILRASVILPQLQEERRFDPLRFNEGGYLILWGLFKKTVVADNLAPLVNGVYGADPSTLTGGMVLFATYAFAFQIYCDFSGYTDIARGCAKLMGFELPLNFDLPYAARDPADFWRRWHISLSSWLRDYLYIPLGGNRRGPGRTYVNLMATMLLGGLWHGASWTFVLWGAYQGALLVIWRLAGARWERVPRVVQWVVFFHLVCLGWLIFRAESLDQVGAMLRTLGHGVHLAGRAGRLAWRTLLFSSPVILVQVAQYVSRRLDVILDLPAPARGALYAAWTVGIFVFGSFAGNEFIYFQF